MFLRADIDISDHVWKSGAADINMKSSKERLNILGFIRCYADMRKLIPLPCVCIRR